MQQRGNPIGNRQSPVSYTHLHTGVNPFLVFVFHFANRKEKSEASDQDNVEKKDLSFILILLSTLIGTAVLFQWAIVTGLYAPLRNDSPLKQYGCPEDVYKRQLYICTLPLGEVPVTATVM